MGGFFGVVSKKDCVADLYFGIDYHTHLGARRGGMVVSNEQGFDRAIHNIETSPFRLKFADEVDDFKGNIGIGCISDTDPQPLLVHSHLGSFAITTVGRINNVEELKENCFSHGITQFMEMSKGRLNTTELVAALVNQKSSIVEGLTYVQDMIEGSMSVLIMTSEGIYCSRDKLGRTPVVIAKKEDAYCVTFETSAIMNLGYHHVKDLGPGEIVFINCDSFKVLKEAGKDMKMCAFLWVYYGYPTSTYEGMNVEVMRYNCGKEMAKRDSADVDIVAGVPDSGFAHAIGYANASGIQYARPFIKYTPTWPRSFTPQNQVERNLIAKMKLIPVKELIKDQKLLLIDDSIVRGTQLGETTEFLYDSGAKEVHVRPACPPNMFGCKYLNFARFTSEMDLISRRVICDLEGTTDVSLETLQEYADPDTEKYRAMVDEIGRRLNFTSLDYARLDELQRAIGLNPEHLCSYCWNGKE